MFWFSGALDMSESCRRLGGRVGAAIGTGWAGYCTPFWSTVYAGVAGTYWPWTCCKFGWTLGANPLNCPGDCQLFIEPAGEGAGELSSLTEWVAEVCAAIVSAAGWASIPWGMVFK